MFYTNIEIQNAYLFNNAFKLYREIYTEKFRQYGDHEAAKKEALTAYHNMVGSLEIPNKSDPKDEPVDKTEVSDKVKEKE